MTTLIFGARPGSLGEAIRFALQDEHVSVITAGLNDDGGLHENLLCDVTNGQQVVKVLDEVWPDKIVITVGINEPKGLYEGGYHRALQRAFAVNCAAPMFVLDMALKMLPELTQVVVISSNSAHIARTNSGPYCTSKAALSMAWRVAAREREGRPLIYGYEFGLLAGTPMTRQSAADFTGPLSRMKGAPDGLTVGGAAQVVASNLMHPWHGLNGTMLRLDAGEQ